MARPGHAARTRDEFEVRRPEYPKRYRTEAAQSQRPTVPARIGAGSRPRRSLKRSDGLLLWRVLGVSAATLILGMGGLLAYNLIVLPSDTARAKVVQAAASAIPPAGVANAPQPGAPLATLTQPAPSATAPVPGSGAIPAQAPGVIGAAGHSQSALKVASILGSGGGAPALPVPEAGPTAADFARPAFLEPIDDATDDDATIPPGAVETVAEGTPPNAVAPLPVPRPTKMAAADTGATDDDGATARIRSAVTMRSGPRRSASAIGTLEAGTKVKLYSCKSWCEVSSGDKRGWVYKSSVDR